MIILYYFSLFLTLSSSLLLNQCQKTPFWKLNLCQIDCNKCGINAICQECPNGFNLTQSQCQSNSQLIYHNTYFTSPQFNSTVINQKMFKASNQYLTENNIVRICEGNTYKFDMLGLFKQQTRVTFNVNFNTPVTEVKIKFNFLTIQNDTKLQVVLNGEQVHQEVYKNSGIDNSYEPSQSSINYLKIPSLKESSVNAIIKKVETNPIPFSESQFNKNNQLRLQITYTTNTTSTSPFWAFSDFSLVGKKCQQCIPQRLITLSTNVAIAIGITSAALLILILIMYTSVKLQQNKRLNSSHLTTTYHNLNQNNQKEEEKEQEKDNDLKIRQTINKTRQSNKNIKKNKNS